MPSHVSLEEGDVTHPVGGWCDHGGRDGGDMATSHGTWPPPEFGRGKEWILS